MRLLLTRAADAAAASAGRLRAMGHAVVVSPVTVIAPLDWLWPDGAFDGVVITSAHAVRFLDAAQAARIAALPAYAVGEHSAAAARAAGLNQVYAAHGGEAALARLAAQHAPERARLLYLAGRMRKGGLVGLLAAEGLRCVPAETYDAIAASGLAPAAAGALRAGAIDAVLHYSARSAAIFMQLADAAGLAGQTAQLRHLCLSQDVAAALALTGGAGMDIAATPDEAALFALLGACQGER